MGKNNVSVFLQLPRVTAEHC